VTATLPATRPARSRPRLPDRGRVRRLARAYRAYVRTAAAIALQYRAALLARAAITVVWVLLLTRIWTAVYQGRDTLAGFDLPAAVTYVTLANLQASVLTSPVSAIMSSRVRSGEVLFDLIRPVGYLGQMVALEAGHAATTLGVVLLAAPAALLVGGVQAPAGPVAVLGYLVTLALGWLLSTLLDVLVGLTAFWAVDIMGFAMLYRLVAQFLAGTAVPLALFPGPLGALARALPFQFVAYVPAATYVGRIRAGELLATAAFGVGWVVVLAGLLVLVWRRAYRRVAVHGG
jgi:ABC-2 type transport system permease protein